MKRIALAIEQFSPYAGGAEAYAVGLARRLVREGWEVHVYGESWDGDPPEVRFHRIAVPRWLPSWARMLSFARTHRRKTAGAGFDVVLGFGNTLRMNVYQSHGGVHRLSTRRKTFAEPDPGRRAVKRLMILLSAKQWVRHWIESAPFRQEPRPRIVAISDMIRDDMVRSHGVAESEITVVYNGVDTERFHPRLRERRRGEVRPGLGIGPEETVFLFPSYDLRKKGILPLVEAAGILRSGGTKGFRILVAGGAPWPGLVRRIRALGLERVVRFAGRVRDMEGLYADSDVLVLPTYYDACSLVVIEAMACGLPAVTTRCNGAAGIITPGVDGYVVDHPPAAEELSDRMRRLLDSGRREAMGGAAARCARRYDSRESYGAMIEIFEAAAGRGGGPE